MCSSISVCTLHYQPILGKDVVWMTVSYISGLDHINWWMAMVSLCIIFNLKSGSVQFPWYLIGVHALFGHESVWGLTQLITNSGFTHSCPSELKRAISHLISHVPCITLSSQHQRSFPMVCITGEQDITMEINIWRKKDYYFLKKVGWFTVLYKNFPLSLSLKMFWKYIVKS